MKPAWIRQYLPLPASKPGLDARLGLLRDVPCSSFWIRLDATNGYILRFVGVLKWIQVLTHYAHEFQPPCSQRYGRPNRR